MPRQNRVTPLSDLIATPARGLVYGNRGCLHDDTGRIRSRWATRRWIACRLEFKGWHRGKLLQPGKFTELFFLDEATAFAAGHRPCALCRREDYVRFTELFPGPSGADAMDEQLHAERVDGRERRLHEARLENLPDGAIVLERDEPWLVLGGELLRWTPARPGDAHHAAVTRRDPPRRLGRRRAAPPPDRVPLRFNARPAPRSRLPARTAGSSSWSNRTSLKGTTTSPPPSELDLLAMLSKTTQ